MNVPRQTRSWLMQRARLWQQLNAALPRLRRGRTSAEDALHALEGYRGLARDLATARQVLPGSSTTAALETLYASFHALIHRPARNSWASVLHKLRVEIPQTMHELRPALQWLALLFVMSAAAGWWLIDSHPTLISLVASDAMIDRVEAGGLWTDGILNVAPASVLSAKIFTNNIVVSLFAFCSGVFYGLGTFYAIANNGVMLGALFAFTRQHGVDDRLLSFVFAHGVVEISMILVAGAAGTALGEALMRPQNDGRAASLQRCLARVGPVLVLACVVLIGCGLIEGFVSPNETYPAVSRAVIGIGWFIVVCGAFTGRLWGRNRRQVGVRRAVAP
jgi:uncharacterized membrane protein SpoIIM required for sporulation